MIIPNPEIPLFDKKIAIETGAYYMLSEILPFSEIPKVAQNIHAEKPNLSFHSIKSTANSLGFIRLADYADRMESLGPDIEKDIIKHASQNILQLNEESIQAAIN